MEPPKKLINSTEDCVDEALCGLVRASSGLSLLRGHRVVLRSDLDQMSGKVALLSGGGSGHEPAHGGYVGAGMLSAAVAGGVFASPPPASILAAILCLHGAGASGVLLIVKNYTGDRLNFGLAAEQARNHGVDVEMVVVADDCAFTCPSKAGKRGLCGTILIHKLAGALADEGCSLVHIVAKVTEVLQGIGTLGVSLSPCSVPGCRPSFELPPGDMELGLGIHGEPGVRRSKVATADEVVSAMIDHMTDVASQSCLHLRTGDVLVVCVNNLGALSRLEMAVVTRAAILCLENRGMVVARVMAGSFMTSLEMAGMSLTLMRANPEILKLFDAKTSAPAWPNLSGGCASGRSYLTDPTPMSKGAPQDVLLEGPQSPVMRKVLERVCSTLLEYREELNALDRASGDGDCGNTHAQAAKAIQVWLQSHVVPGCPGQLLSALAGLVQEKMGGSSGALYSLFLTAASGHMTGGRSHAAAWANAVHAGMQAMRRYGGADLGDRTMLDALCPAVDELMKVNSTPPGGEMAALKAAAQRAADGAESTRSLAAKAGRASYIAAERLTLPDPGAKAVAAILSAVVEALEEP
ncbi:triokinase/FMN cyclase [Syngnathus scovelli]|uniref:triokinase/FMN cyclase n=1 Tax=Syngnathus scovelli TaxID=161590 RepID=UPI0021100BE5|nr:triokinase/FMN cyclase [Syngnathus scovelli]XP_049603570.1 triokinase/FMN cyclase [Syngnathus scovelli]XP_049603582.1 triokinase/FMN cyclase [Syngnathus scovelli]XP_049603592.1 triokinase/FMN cyclase [Syngnathus scovelli]XP_049603603.1 triokinase/FMN cyclase [Syngnathus scovelli]